MVTKKKHERKNRIKTPLDKNVRNAAALEGNTMGLKNPGLDAAEKKYVCDCLKHEIFMNVDWLKENYESLEKIFPWKDGPVQVIMANGARSLCHYKTPLKALTLLAPGDEEYPYPEIYAPSIADDLYRQLDNYVEIFSILDRKELADKARQKVWEIIEDNRKLLPWTFPLTENVLLDQIEIFMRGGEKNLLNWNPIPPSWKDVEAKFLMTRQAIIKKFKKAKRNLPKLKAGNVSQADAERYAQSVQTIRLLR